MLARSFSQSLSYTGKQKRKKKKKQQLSLQYNSNLFLFSHHAELSTFLNHSTHPILCVSLPSFLNPLLPQRTSVPVFSACTPRTAAGKCSENSHCTKSKEIPE